MFKKPSLVVLVASFLFLAAASPALGQIFPGGVRTHETNKKPTGLPANENNQINGAEILTKPTGKTAYVYMWGPASENSTNLKGIPGPSERSKDGYNSTTKETGVPASKKNLIPGLDNQAPDQENNYIAGGADTTENDWFYTTTTIRDNTVRVVVDDNNTENFTYLYIDCDNDGTYAEGTDNTIGRTDVADQDVFIRVDPSWTTDDYFWIDNVRFEAWINDNAQDTFENVKIQSSSWIEMGAGATAGDPFQIDLDNDTVAENLNAVLSDNDSNGFFDTLYLSGGGEDVYDNGTLDDNYVSYDGSDDEIVTSTGTSVEMGKRHYSFTVTFDENAQLAGVTKDVGFTIDNYYTDKIINGIDVDGNGTTDPLFYAMVDENSDGIYENLYLSAFDDNYGEGDLTDNNIVLDNDERLSMDETSTTIWGENFADVWMGDYRYAVHEANPPLENDLGIGSTTWYNGKLPLDIDLDGSTDNVNFLLTDNNLPLGIFDNLDLSLNDNYGENLTTVFLTSDNDVRVSGSRDLLVGESKQGFNLFYLRGPVTDPADNDPDFWVRSKSWYRGPLQYWAAEGWADNFAYVVAWDKNSDGVQENLAIDPNLDNDFGDSNFWYTHQDTPVKPLWLPSGMNYGWELSSFEKNQAVNNLVQFDPLDDAKPSASDFAPEENIILSAKKPTFEVTLADRGSSTAAGKTTFGDAVTGVAIQWDKDLDDVPDENLYMAAFTDNTLGADGWYRFLENEPKVEADASWSPTKEELKVTPLDVLPEGQIIVRYVAVDKAYNDVDDNWSFIVDRSRPEITITEPVEEFETYDSSVKLEGVVSDMIGYRLKVNGERISAPGGSFSKEIDLKGGKNTITVEAIDDAGNKVTKERTVTRKLGKEIPTEKAPAFPTDVIVPVVAVAIVAAVIFLAVSKRS